MRCPRSCQLTATPKPRGRVQGAVPVCPSACSRATCHPLLVSSKPAFDSVVIAENVRATVCDEVYNTCLSMAALFLGAHQIPPPTYRWTGHCTRSPLTSPPFSSTPNEECSLHSTCSSRQSSSSSRRIDRLRSSSSPGVAGAVVSPPVQAPSSSALTLHSLVAADATPAPPQARLVPSKGWLDGSVLLSVPNG